MDAQDKNPPDFIDYAVLPQTKEFERLPQKNECCTTIFYK